MSVVGKNLGMRMCEWIADARKGAESRDGQQPEVACSACCASFDILQQLRPSDGSKLGALSLLRNRSPEKRSMSDRPNGTTMREHWDSVFQARPDPFGSEPSDSAKVAAQAFARLHVAHRDVLDISSGTGRDTLFFAERGMHVVALAFSGIALDELRAKARSSGVPRPIRTVQHDVRESPPFPDSTFHAGLAHMLFCIGLSTRRVVGAIRGREANTQTAGSLVYTARTTLFNRPRWSTNRVRLTTDDPNFGSGVHRGEHLFEDEGFVVHFFDRRIVVRHRGSIAA